MRLAIMVEVQEGLSWPRWAALIAAAERWGFSGVFLSDHFGNGKQEALETITALTYLAIHSRTLRFGTLVSPISMRDPVMLARQAMVINDLSGGRMVLGIGAGWQEDEHTTFGYNLGDVGTRMERFEEGVQVISQLMRCDTPVSFEGRFYHLRAGQLPQSQQPMPILIGGNGPRRTLPIVAKYADIWNCMAASAEAFGGLSASLDTLLQRAGRKVGDVKRSVFLPVCCWRNTEEKERLAAAIRRRSIGGDKSADALFELLRTEMGFITGPPDSVIEQLRAYERAGADELMMMSLAGAEHVDYLETLGTL